MYIHKLNRKGNKKRKVDEVLTENYKNIAKINITVNFSAFPLRFLVCPVRLFRMYYLSSNVIRSGDNAP